MWGAQCPCPPGQAWSYGQCLPRCQEGKLRHSTVPAPRAPCPGPAGLALPQILLHEFHSEWRWGSTATPRPNLRPWSIDCPPPPLPVSPARPARPRAALPKQTAEGSAGIDSAGAAVCLTFAEERRASSRAAAAATAAATAATAVTTATAATAATPAATAATTALQPLQPPQLLLPPPSLQPPLQPLQL